MSESALQTPPAMQEKVTLVDVLDRLLHTGVVAYGDIILSIADLDLVYLNLRAVLSAIGTLEGSPEGQVRSNKAQDDRSGTKEIIEGHASLPLIAGGAPESCQTWGDVQEEEGRVNSEGPARSPDAYFQTPPHVLDEKSGRKLELDPKKAEQGLAKLVLTLINLLRKLMERQAIRRMEKGTLSTEELEKAGEAFRRLDERIKDMSRHFGLKEEDLNLDLGPLGNLV